MTDLERVRDWAEDSFNFPLIDEALDAHLREDAGLADWTKKIEAKLSKTQAVLARLRDELESLRAQSCAWSCVGVPYEKRGDAHKRTCRP